jgi:hypothetical protein
LQTNHDVACVDDRVSLIPHVADTVARVGDPFKVAAHDTIGTDRLYMLKLTGTASPASTPRLATRWSGGWTPSFAGCRAAREAAENDCLEIRTGR